MIRNIPKTTFQKLPPLNRNSERIPRRFFRRAKHTSQQAAELALAVSVQKALLQGRDIKKVELS
jgi:hypothetical protein